MSAEDTSPAAVQRVGLPSAGPEGPASEQPAPQRVGLLVIGDEILAGHTQDTNTHWLAGRLKDMGIRLVRVEVCTDDLSDVRDSVRRFLNDLDLDVVITSGGLGPTHDDRTMEGIAAALDVDLVLEPEWEKWMRERVAYGHELGYFNATEPNAGMMKMAHLPRGALAMPNHRGTALGAIVESDGTTLFTLPGVPTEFKLMFDESVAPRLRAGTVQHVEELVLYTEESRFYEKLVELDGAHPDVTLGSYPHPGYIVIRATGDEAEAKALIDKMRSAGKDYLEPPDKKRAQS